GIVAAAGAGDPETALVMLMQSEGVEPGEATLCAQADGLAAEFSGATAGDIVAGVVARAAAEQGLDSLAAALAARSPTSLEAIVESHRAARRLPDVGAVLALDLRLAAFMARQSDFAEGVRAVLVDKDHKPNWRPADFSDVDRAAIEGVIGARG
ncbi:MAG: enoyl-CoA hydratase/isomerase family protein, partial [Devosia sp.]